MKKSVRAIVIHGDKLLAMARNKFGERYYTLVGGAVDEDETLEQALHREIEEETTLKVKNPRLVFIDHAGEPFGDQYIYLCAYDSGEPKLHEASEEAALNKASQNIHEPIWLDKTQLKNIDFRSTKLKKYLISSLEQGFPKYPVEF